MTTSADYVPAVAIYPNGKTRKGNCKRTAITDVTGAVDRLRLDLAAYVATQDEADQVLAIRQAGRAHA